MNIPHLQDLHVELVDVDEPAPSIIWTGELSALIDANAECEADLAVLYDDPLCNEVTIGGGAAPMFIVRVCEGAGQ